VAGLGSSHTEDDPRRDAYEAGRQAFAEGRPNVDNPYPSDIVDHLAWACGWSEARDEVLEGRAAGGR
jgi:hypothetical protein